MLEFAKVEFEEEAKSQIIELKVTDLYKQISERTGISIEQIKNRESTLVEIREKIRYQNIAVPEFERLQALSILQGNEINIEKGIGFVLIPHNEEFRQIFDNSIKPALEENGIIAQKAEDIYKPGSILSQVWQEIRRAEVIIADVSDKNPNVIYELGLCYGIQRCPILLVKDEEDLPFNLRNLRYITYENTIHGGKKLRESLSKTISEFLSAVRS